MRTMLSPPSLPGRGTCVKRPLSSRNTQPSCEQDDGEPAPAAAGTIAPTSASAVPAADGVAAAAARIAMTAVARVKQREAFVRSNKVIAELLRHWGSGSSTV